MAFRDIEREEMRDTSIHKVFGIPLPAPKKEQKERVYDDRNAWKLLKSLQEKLSFVPPPKKSD